MMKAVVHCSLDEWGMLLESVCPCTVEKRPWRMSVSDILKYLKHMPLDHVSMFAVSGHASSALHSDTMLRVQAVAINGRPHNAWPCKVWSDGPVADDLAALGGFFIRNQR